MSTVEPYGAELQLSAEAEFHLLRFCALIGLGRLSEARTELGRARDRGLTGPQFDELVAHLGSEASGGLPTRCPGSEP